MPTVALRIPALPAHVRTARLVAVAVARRSGVEEALLDEVRLAVGEACSRAVHQHQRNAPHEPVLVALSDDDGRFRVSVQDVVPAPVATGERALEVLARAESEGAGAAPEDALGSDDGPGAAIPGAVRLAVVSSLVDEVEVRSGPGGAEVAMSWPALPTL